MQLDIKEKNTTKSENNNILAFCNRIPDDMKSLILSYLPPKTLVFLTQPFYHMYHPLLKKENWIPPSRYENYVRDMVRRDCEFVFRGLLQENHVKWLNQKKYIYRNTTYANYHYFLLDFCLENEATKCCKVIRNWFEETGLGRNLHKKNNAIQHRRWKL
jgi:hypothetical protein